MGLEQVQLRPGMYIGNCADGTGLDNMVVEVVAEALTGAPPCERVTVTLHDDGLVSVCDNGAGLPVATDDDWGVPIAELLVTQLGAAALRPGRMPERFGFPVVNALSEEFTVRIWRGGLEYAMRFYCGAFVHRLTCTGAAGTVRGLPRRGTEVALRPSPRFFSSTEYDFDRLVQCLSEFELTTCGAVIVLADRRGGATRQTTIVA
jgi:DNA gyrase subunit B